MLLNFFNRALEVIYAFSETVAGVEFQKIRILFPNLEYLYTESVL